ncbi:hypothetical protein ROS217_01625 [Roseovarius sp. 217]|nr:hypothetical protein ROS217_01625 [Roseovarius sp. 217]
MKRFMRQSVIASCRLKDHKICVVISADFDQFSYASSVILEAVMIASWGNIRIQVIFANVDPNDDEWGRRRCDGLLFLYPGHR